jgi:hypothetical protein
MMEVIPMYFFVLAAIWIVGCVWLAYLVVGHAKGKSLSNDQSFLLAGILLLVIAPCVGIAEMALGDELTFWGGGIQMLIAALLFAAAYRERQYRLNPEKNHSTASFREKTAGLVLIAQSLLCINYFTRIIGSDFESVLPTLIGSLVSLIIMMIIGSTLLAMFHMPKREIEAPMDERDKAIDLRSTTNAYYALGAGFWIMPVVIFLELDTLVAFNIWFAVLMLSEIVRYGSVLAYYRWGEI